MGQTFGCPEITKTSSADAFEMTCRNDKNKTLILM